MKTLWRGSSFFILSITALILFFFTGKAIYNMVSSMTVFEVKNLEVYGLETISKEKFFELLPEKYTGNLLKSYFINFESFITDRFERINSVKVKRDFLNKTISFNVIERKPVAFKYYHGKKYGIDIENRSFLLYETLPDLPELIFEGNFDYKVQKDVIELIVLLNKSINKKEYKFDKFFVNAEGNISFLICEKTKVIWGKFFSSTFNEKIEYLKKILYILSKNNIDGSDEVQEVMPEYIDLRMCDTGRVVVKTIELERDNKKIKKLKKN